jgi:competence protein ComEC
MLSCIQYWRYRRVHPSFLFAWLALGVMAGLVVGRFGHLGQPLLVSDWLILILVLPLIIALKKQRWWAVLVIVFVGLLIGYVRGESFADNISQYNKYFNQRVVLTGQVVNDPEYGNRGDKKFLLSNVEINNVNLPGTVSANTFSIDDIRLGDEVILNGKLKPGYGSYQANLGFANLVQVNSKSNLAREVRDNFAAGVRNSISEPMSSLGVGFVVGQRSALPNNLDDQMRNVGLTHIVVASGYNLTILVRFSRRLLSKHSKYLATVVSSFLMFCFVMISGLSPSMSRAALVAGLSLLVWHFGRNFHPVVLLLISAAITAYIYPVYVWGDVGWQLSFLAFTGVMIVGPLIDKLIWGKKRPRPLIRLVTETLSAEIMTMPIILATFGYAPVIGLLANSLVGPLIPISMLLTTVSGVAGMILPSISGWIGAPAQLILSFIVSIVQFLASFHVVYNIQLSSQVAILIYILSTVLIIISWKLLRYDFKGNNLVE